MTDSLKENIAYISAFQQRVPGSTQIDHKRSLWSQCDCPGSHQKHEIGLQNNMTSQTMMLQSWSRNGKSDINWQDISHILTSIMSKAQLQDTTPNVKFCQCVASTRPVQDCSNHKHRSPLFTQPNPSWLPSLSEAWMGGETRGTKVSRSKRPVLDCALSSQ